MIRFFRERPWIWIIVAFAVLISSWVVLLRIANENRPASVEMQTINPDERAEP